MTSGNGYKKDFDFEGVKRYKESLMMLSLGVSGLPLSNYHAYSVLFYQSASRYKPLP